MREEEMTTFAFKLPRGLLKRLKAESERRGITVAGLIRMTLLEELERG